jgi:hypothetical protein
MRPLLAFAVLLAPLSALAQPAPRPVRVTNFPEVQEVTGSVEVSNPPEPGGACAPFHLVGFTAATFTGGHGVLGFTRACQAEFPGSRFCTSVEVMETAVIPAGLPAGEAWVRPVFVDGPGSNVVDASGSEDVAEQLSCAGWRESTPGPNGLVVDGAGRFRSTRRSPTGMEGCHVPRAVACCAGPR